MKRLFKKVSAITCHFEQPSSTVVIQLQHLQQGVSRCETLLPSGELSSCTSGLHFRCDHMIDVSYAEVMEICSGGELFERIVAESEKHAPAQE